MGGDIDMSKIKKVGFNFFRPTTIVDGENKYLSLKELFETVRKKYTAGKEKEKETGEDQEYKYVYTYNYEPARLADIDFDTKYYHLTFERLNYQVPNRTTLHGESTALELEEDEWIGIDVSVLYDPEDHIVMIQRNRDSIGPQAITQFIRSILDELGFGGDFDLPIVSDRTAKRRALNQAAYRKISARLTGAKASNILDLLWGNSDNVGVDTIEITFNSKIGKKDKIDHDFSKTVLQEYSDNPEILRLQIRSREEEEDPVEAIDLIDHKLVAFKIFDFTSDGRQLNPISIYEEMIKIYEGYDNNEGFKHKIMRT